MDERTDVMAPKVSIIMPIYNAENYLRECLDSVVAQTLQEIEIICVDDGSTDDTLACAREAAGADSRFVFYQKENGYGVSIGLTDYDLGFDDIPFGYLGTYAEMVPFYSDDLITFFGHRNGKWYYVELGPQDPNAGYYW